MSGILFEQGMTSEQLLAASALALAALVTCVLLVRWLRGAAVPPVLPGNFGSVRVILFPLPVTAPDIEAESSAVSTSAPWPPPITPPPISPGPTLADGDDFKPSLPQPPALASRDPDPFTPSGLAVAASAWSQTVCDPVPAIAASIAPATGLPSQPSIARRRPKPATEPLDTVLSPETLLARAYDLLATGANDAAAGQLRLCTRLASKLRQPLIEAAARLELGDLARANGDLTTACEHWQIARTLFADHACTTDADAIETRMERAGCPTDWVLTQF